MSSAPPETEALLRGIEWRVLRRLDGLLQGDHRTLLRGQGLDLADLREYQPGDDVRHMDWNVTARMGQPHVRVFIEDREMTAWFLLDLSASVDFGSFDLDKRDISTGFVGAVARLLSRHGNRIGAMLYGRGVDTVLPARSGRQHVLALLHALRHRPDAPVGHPTRLKDLLDAATGVVRRRCTLFVVSDFISEPGWEAPLGRLAQRHDVVAVRLFDPLELDMPDLGLVTLRDAETGEQMLVDTHDPGFRKRFARIAAQREAQLRASFEAAGVDTLELATDGDLFDAVVRFVDLRLQRLRSTAAAAGGRPMPTHLHAAASAANSPT